MIDVEGLEVALEGLENILRTGQDNFVKIGQENKFKLVLENDGGLAVIHEMLIYPHIHIKKRALKILDLYNQKEADKVMADQAPNGAYDSAP